MYKFDGEIGGLDSPFFLCHIHRVSLNGESDMKKPFKDSDIKAGAVVAFNMLPDATWFDVIKRDGFMITIRERADIIYSEQTADVSMVCQVKKTK